MHDWELLSLEAGIVYQFRFRNAARETQAVRSLRYPAIQMCPAHSQIVCATPSTPMTQNP